MARKLGSVAALVALVVGVIAICPCLPVPDHEPGRPSASPHSCCAIGESPVLTAAAESCCKDGALTDRTAATPSAGVSLGADAGVVAVVTWSPSPLSVPQLRPAAFGSSPPSILRI